MISIRRQHFPFLRRLKCHGQLLLFHFLLSSALWHRYVHAALPFIESCLHFITQTWGMSFSPNHVLNKDITYFIPGITMSSTILQNELRKKLPVSFTSQFAAGAEIAYSAIPEINGLAEP